MWQLTDEEWDMLEHIRKFPKYDPVPSMAGYIMDSQQAEATMNAARPKQDTYKSLEQMGIIWWKRRNVDSPRITRLTEFGKDVWRSRYDSQGRRRQVNG